MAFILKNVSSGIVRVLGVDMDPGQEFPFYSLEGEVGAAVERGDLAIVSEDRDDQDA